MSIKIKEVIDNLSESPDQDEYATAIVLIRDYNNEVLELAKQWSQFHHLMLEKTSTTKGGHEVSKEKFDLVKSILQHYHDECKEMDKAFAPEVSDMIQYYLNIVAQDLGFALNTTPDLQQAMLERWEETDEPTKAIIDGRKQS